MRMGAMTERAGGHLASTDLSDGVAERMHRAFVRVGCAW
jgi:hypothetical protein